MAIPATRPLPRRLGDQISKKQLGYLVGGIEQYDIGALAKLLSATRGALVILETRREREDLHDSES